MSTHARDREASDLQASGLTWVEVAMKLNLANGGVARRCAMRHRDRETTQPTDNSSTDTSSQPPDNEPEDTSPNETVTRVSQTEITINGRTVVPKTEVSIRGESGRFTFQYSLREDEITVWGGQPQYEKWRTFKIERVRTVHRKPRLRKNAEALQEMEPVS